MHVLANKTSSCANIRSGTHSKLVPSIHQGHIVKSTYMIEEVIVDSVGIKTRLDADKYSLVFCTFNSWISLVNYSTHLYVKKTTFKIISRLMLNVLNCYLLRFPRYSLSVQLKYTIYMPLTNLSDGNHTMLCPAKFVIPLFICLVKIVC